MTRAARDRLARVAARPDPGGWEDDEPLTLAEAAALFFPDGLFTVSSLRRAAAQGQLAKARIAGKDITTPKAIRELLAPCKAAKRSPRASGSAPVATVPALGSFSTEAGKSAQAAARQTLKERRSRSKLTSPPGTSQPSGLVIPLRSP